jgi:hypothetical protein
MCINGIVPDFIAEIGFCTVDSVTILGLEIEGDSGTFNKSFDKICSKVRNNIAIWSRYNLSLPGRICIAKTMLYSQVNYLGCFLTIPEQFLTRISDMISKFVCGNLSIAEKRLYLPASMGGLGLFELKTFLAAQRCSWIQRALDLNEKWKLTLFYKSNGNIVNIRKSFLNKNATPVLYGIVESFEEFVGGFSKYNENFWESNLFENNAHMVSLRQKQRLTKSFFDEDFFDANKNKILNLKVTDFYVNKESLIHKV